MSKVFKGIKKVFKKVVKGVGKVVKKVARGIKKYGKYIAIGAAVYFTAGAAMASFPSAAGAAGASGAAGAGALAAPTAAAQAASTASLTATLAGTAGQAATVAAPFTSAGAGIVSALKSGVGAVVDAAGKLMSPFANTVKGMSGTEKLLALQTGAKFFAGLSAPKPGDRWEGYGGAQPMPTPATSVRQDPAGFMARVGETGQAPDAEIDLGRSTPTMDPMQAPQKIAAGPPMPEVAPNDAMIDDESRVRFMEQFGSYMPSMGDYGGGRNA